MRRFLFIIAMSSACCTSDDNVCVAESTDTGSSEGGVPTDPGANCCADFGKLDGYDNICAVSEAPRCYGCDGQPVLCMTTGCGVPFKEDCCLVDGETVACAP